MLYNDQTHKTQARLPLALSGIEIKAIENAAYSIGINRTAFIKLAIRKYINEMEKAVV